MAYKLMHPSGGEIKTTADRVPMYESQGWKTAPTAKKPPADDADDESGSVGSNG